MRYCRSATSIILLSGTVVLVAASFLYPAAVTFRDSAAGFSIPLPAGWKDSSLSSTSRIFRDSANVYHAIIGVVRHDYDTTLYRSEKDWCISMSAAYEISVESNPFFGFIYSRDSTLQDGLFAMYANAEYGMPVRSESIRWTARNHRGYELYIYTDTLDMYLHFALYKSLLDSVRVFSKTSAIAMPDKRSLPAPRLNAFRIPLSGLPRTIPGFQGRVAVVNSAGRRIATVTYNNGVRTGDPLVAAINDKNMQIFWGIIHPFDK